MAFGDDPSGPGPLPHGGCQQLAPPPSLPVGTRGWVVFISWRINGPWSRCSCTVSTIAASNCAFRAVDSNHSPKRHFLTTSLLEDPHFGNFIKLEIKHLLVKVHHSLWTNPCPDALVTCIFSVLFNTPFVGLNTEENWWMPNIVLYLLTKMITPKAWSKGIGGISIKGEEL